ncbi:MAG: FG-GAP-like repeat-containing protein, partial [bacterium]|nr:FG-GAP-like repeat-containing protein [bacterium]
YTLDDDNLGGTRGNNNKLLNPSETVDINVALQNIGAAGLVNVNAKLTSSDPYVTILPAQQVQYYGNMVPGSIVTSAGSFRFWVNADVSSGYTIPFKLLVTDGTNWTDEAPLLISFAIPVYVKGQVQISYIYLDDPSSLRNTNNGDGIWNTSPRELVNISVAVHNYGTETINGARIDIVELPPNYYYGCGQFLVEREANYWRTVTHWWQNIGNILPGNDSLTATFRFDYLGDTTRGNFSGPIYVYITDADGNTWVDVFTQEMYQREKFYYFKNQPHTIHDDMDLNVNNNVDGIINPGETIRITSMNAKNITGSRTGASALMWAEQWNSVTKSYEPDPWVSISDNQIGFPVVDSGGVSNSDGYYQNWLQFTVDPACPSDHIIYFRLQISYFAQHTSTFTHEVVRNRSSDVRAFYPNFTRWFDVNSHPNAIVDDINTTGHRGNYDGYVNPGETVKFIPPVYNMTWDVALGDSIAYLTIDDPYITLIKATTQIDPILPRALSPGGLSRDQVESIAHDTAGANRYFMFYVHDTCPMNAEPDDHWALPHHDLNFDLYITDTIGRRFVNRVVIPVVNATPDPVTVIADQSHLAFDAVTYFFTAGYSPQQVGYPYMIETTYGQFTGGYIKTSPVVGDLTGDGNDEIIISVGSYGVGSGYVYAFNSAAQVLPGWPQEIAGYLVESSPALGDFDNNGQLDAIVIGSGLSVGGSDGKIYVWQPNGTIRSGWTNVTTDRPINTTPVIADLNNDGIPEVIIGSRAWGSNPGKIYVYNANGSLRWSFPVGGFTDVAATPAVGDINNDGLPEIVFATNSSYGMVFAGRLCTIQDAGTTGRLLWESPLPSATYSAPALGDLDWDGTLEIVLGSIDSSFSIFNASGAIVTTFRQFYGSNIGGDISSAPAIADLNGDSFPEVIIAGSDSMVYSITYDVPTGMYIPYSRYMSRFGTNIRFGSPSIADVNGDGLPEIVVGANESFDNAYDYIYNYPNSDDTGYHYNLHIISSNGASEAERSPMPTIGVIYGSPMFAKIGNKLNIVLGDLAHNVYVWETGFDYNPAVNVWNGFRHDAQRTGCYPSKAIGETNGIRYLTHILDSNSDDTIGLSFGNGNSAVNPGETIEMGIVLKNYIYSMASSVYALLSSNDP